MESAVVFPCAGEQLVGVVTSPVTPGSEAGLVVIVGGPQYRVGSHRQFTLLTRALAEHDIPSIRFDYRGMGDSTGTERSFQDVGQDIRAAVDTFVEQSGAKRVVLWGLCDGASAACFYAPTDERVAGLVLLNPWVRTQASKARTYLRHYYWRRLFEADFWAKMLTVRGAIVESVRSFFRFAGTASLGNQLPNDLSSTMAAGLMRAQRPALIVLSGDDYVAREFDDVSRARGSPWASVGSLCTTIRIEEADHTFSTRAWRDAVAQRTLDWMESNGFMTIGRAPQR